MSAVAFNTRVDVRSAADTALNAATKFWFTVAMIGQWAFLYYILAVYGGSSITGQFQAWTKNRLLIKGYVPGDTAGNVAFAAHALLAAIIAFGGALQLIPQVRKHAAFHRWNGRLYFLTVFGVSFTGLYMAWVRGARMSIVSAAGTSLNALLIIVFAVLAWRTAVTRDVAAHRRWALRTYLASNGQWFIRVGMVAWMILNNGRDGGFFLFWNFGCYLVPLAVLELYLRTKERGSPAGRFAMAGGLFVLTILMGLGIVGTAAFLWQQVLTKL
ncbi:MAG TPA: DUF2306 domain-containing protein [Thermoanaerobaculia bacterium]|nr:DUF2306 domain-containing protein [Thermoanaerobaculia bacterium]